jgi:hypothetical protein
MDSAYIKFNGGIWSEQLKGRYDLENYRSAARTCENFIPTRYGHVEKRAGTKHLGFAKNNDKLCVLHPFQFSINTKFILEFGDLYVRFWANDEQIESAPATPLEVVTPYLEAELYEIQIRAINDVVYITHPNHPVGTLKRIADDDWVYYSTDIQPPFVAPEESLGIGIKSSAATGTTTISQTEVLIGNEIFSSDYIGSKLRLFYPIDTQVVSFIDRSISTTTVFSGSNSYTVGQRVQGVGGIGTPAKRNVFICHTNYPALGDAEPPLAYFDLGIDVAAVTTSGKWSMQTTGVWNGVWAILRSLDGGASYSTIKVLTSSNDANFLVEEDQDGENAIIKIAALQINYTGFQDKTANLTTLSTIDYGEARVDAVAGDGYSCTAFITKTMPKVNERTEIWEESGFSDRQGYPRALSVFDNRLVFAGTTRKPQGFFYSGISDYNSFNSSTNNADDPFFIETISDDQSAVQWLAWQRELFVGTASTEGALQTRNQDEAQSAENLPIIRWNESMGSAHRPALPIRDKLMILQRGRTSLNVLAYSLERDGYTGEEISLLCPHLFSSKVVQMVHTREPYSGAQVITENGDMLHLVYEPSLQVAGWCKLTTQGGSFESVAVLPSDKSDVGVTWGSTENEDDVWVSVKRTVNGTTRRHIERLTTGNTAKQAASDVDNMYFLDASVKVTGTDLTTITGLDHLEGETVYTLADGIKGVYTVVSGSITLDTPADTVVAGLPVTSTFEPFDLETEESIGRRKQLYQSKLLLWNSMGGSIASDGEDYQDIIYHTAGETMDESIPLKNAYSEIFHESSHGREKYWRIQHDDPYPFTLQALAQTFTVSKH